MKVKTSYGKYTRVLDLEIGQLAIGKNTGDILLRTSRGVVSLNHPQWTWDELYPNIDGCMCEVLPVGTVVELTAEV